MRTSDFGLRGGRVIVGTLFLASRVVIEGLRKSFELLKQWIGAAYGRGWRLSSFAITFIPGYRGGKFYTGPRVPPFAPRNVRVGAALPRRHGLDLHGSGINHPLLSRRGARHTVEPRAGELRETLRQAAFLFDEQVELLREKGVRLTRHVLLEPVL